VAFASSPTPLSAPAARPLTPPQALFRENESAGYAKAQHDREAAAREHEAWRAALLEKILAGYTVPFLEQEAAAVKRRRETWLRCVRDFRRALHVYYTVPPPAAHSPHHRYGRDKTLEPVSRERLARVPKPAWFEPLVESEESVLQTVYVVPMRATYRGGASGYYVISADDVETASASFFAEKVRSKRRRAPLSRRIVCLYPATHHRLRHTQSLPSLTSPA